MNILLVAALASSASCMGPSGRTGADAENRPLFENGRSAWVVTVPENAARPVRYAAEELTGTLRKISGATVGVVSAADAPRRNVIRLECTGDEREETFSARTKPGEIVLSGNSPRATLYAVYAFLRDRMDCRWYWPGESGEFLPKLDRYDVTDWERTWHPFFPSREMSICGIWRHRHPDTERWFAKMHFNYGINTPEVQEDLGFLKRFSGHLITLPIVMEPRQKLFAEHPEWFSLLGGKRDLKGIAGCWSNEEYFHYLVTNLTDRIVRTKPDLCNIFVADIVPRCECGGCTADPDKSARYWNYYARLIEEIRKTVPGQRFAGIAYQEYRPIPNVKVKYLDYVEYCQYNRCYYHALGDPKCALNAKSMEEFRGWAAQAPLGLYGYEFDVYDRPMYVPMWNMVADEMKVFKRMNLRRMKTELGVDLNRLGGKEPKPRDQVKQLAHRLANYVWAYMSFDPDADVGTLVRDFCDHVYGAGSREMQAYHALMADAWDHMPTHITYFGTSARNHAERLVTDKVEAAAKAHLTAAAKAAKGEPRAFAEVMLDVNLFKNWVKLAKEARSGGVVHDLKLIRDDNAFNTIGWLNATTKTPKKGKAPAFQKTRFKVYRGTDALHILCECEEKERPDFPRGEPGRFSWEAQTIEIFMDVGDGVSRQIALNPAGGTWGSKDGLEGWDPGAKVRSSYDPDKWVTEIELPYANLDAAPKAGDRWKFMIIRNPGSSKFAGSGWPVNAHRDFGSAATLVFK